MKNDRIFFKSLDTLRFFAFLLVFFQHALLSGFELKDPDQFFSKLITFLCNGSLGVSFFFVLSGFLITFLLLQEKIKTEKVNLVYFYMRRALRIWPLFYAVLVFTLIAYPMLKSLIEADVFEYHYHKLLHFLFLSNFDVIHVVKNFPGKNVAMISITWSVSIEEQFYVVWPLLFRFLPTRFYHLIFPVVIALSLVFRLFYQHDNSVLYFHTFSVMNDLAVGGYAAYLAIFNTTFLTRIKKISTIPIALVYVFGFLFLMNESILLKVPVFGVFVRILESLFFVFIILEQNFSDHSFKKYGDWKILANLGTITYGLYLLHPICIHFTEVAWRYIPFHIDPFSANIIRALISFSLSVALCKLSYRYYESYFLKLKNRFSLIKAH